MDIIANRERIATTIERLSYRLAEDNHSNDSIDLVGIKNSGLILAKEVKYHLERILNKENNISLHHIEIDKKNPVTSSVKLSTDISYFKSKNIILVDDVINSGRTIFYSLRPFMNLEVKKINTLVLVERIYKKYPIESDFVGIRMNTTLKDHIEVIVEGDKIDNIQLV